MDYFSSIIIAGFVGGLVRGLVGFIKNQYRFKSAPFKPWYFLGMMLLSGFVGLVAAWIAKDLKISFGGIMSSAELPSSIAVIVGYAGGDFIESMFKIISKKDNIFHLTKE